MREIWRPVPGYEKCYEASSLGRLRSLPRNGTVGYTRIIKPKITKPGYLDVVLQKNGGRKYCHLHQVIARTFIPNPKHKQQVNHIDGNKMNNRVENLEWNTPSENLRHKFRILGQKASRHGMKSVRCIETEEVFDSIKAAERKYGNCHGAILHAVRGMTKSAYGYHWEYAGDDIEHRLGN